MSLPAPDTRTPEPAAQRSPQTASTWWIFAIFAAFVLWGVQNVLMEVRHAECLAIGSVGFSKLLESLVILVSGVTILSFAASARGQLKIKDSPTRKALVVAARCVLAILALPAVVVLILMVVRGIKNASPDPLSSPPHTATHPPQ